MFKSATFKLTLWYLALVMAISIIFSVVVYHFATDELSVGLHHQTERIFRDFPVFNGNPLLGPDTDVAAGAQHIFWQLAYFNFLVLIVAGYLSYLLARRTLKPIEATHEQQKRFTADVSHELRTPLTSLKMNSEVALLDKKADKAALREALTSNLEDAAKMDMLINSLLRLTKLDAEQAEANFSKQDARELLTAAITQVRTQAKAKQISITPPKGTGTLQADPDSIRQLFTILLDNAVKYSPAGSSVETAIIQSEATTTITVSDHGEGISRTALPHVFDRFYRADSSRGSSERQGFGLGLSIAKLITDRHHGNITLTSQPGKGTTATVQLPAKAFEPVR